MRPLVPWLVGASAAFLAVALAATVVTSAGPAERALVEVRVEGFGPAVVDRCATCHTVGVGRELPDGHPAVPGYHPVERFGCASCHGGEPRALEATWAHGRGREGLLHLGEDGARHPERLEAGCARCHAEVRADGLAYSETLLPQVARGLALFVEKGCWGCHRLADRSFGERGPDLSDVGARLRGDDIRLAVAEPGAHPSSTTMPRLRLAEAELAALTTFLLAQVDPERRAAVATRRAIEARRPGSPVRRARTERGMAAGADVMRRLGCAGCHRLDMAEGHVGPDLRWEGDLRGPRFLRDMVERPALAVTGSRMPPFDLHPTEVEAVLEYLGRLRGSAPEEPELAYRAICARCHGLDGRGRTAVAPYLATRPRDLSDGTFFRESGSERLARAVDEGVAGTAMAPWGRALPAVAGTRVVGLLGRTLHRGGLPSRRRLPPVPPRPDELSGEALTAADGVFDRECSSCHGPRGRGDGPEAEGMRPAPRDLRNAAFVKAQPDERLYRSIAYGVPWAAMPPHLEHYDPAVMWALVESVRELSGEPAAGADEPDLWPWQRAARPAAPAPGGGGAAAARPVGE